MKQFANKEIRNLFGWFGGIGAASLLLAEGLFWLRARCLSVELVLVFFFAQSAVWGVCWAYLKRQDRTLEQATAQIDEYLAGNRSARIDCEEEGALYRLFHAVNSMASVLNAHADNETREKTFLKNTISDISHQLKTPLAALNIYNGLLQDEDIQMSSVREFAALSEQELDRLDTLVQKLLKITRLDAGAIVIEKERENIADMMQDARLHFAYRAKQEQKTILLSGEADAFLFCDREWLLEAVDNLIQNGLNHTEKGGEIRIEWKCFPSSVQLVVKDDGHGIHPEDLYHIFKRFYRSRFSKDTQGLGLGLPLAKAIVEAHGGTIEVDSELGHGASFRMSFPIPTKL